MAFQLYFVSFLLVTTLNKSIMLWNFGFRCIYVYMCLCVYTDLWCKIYFFLRIADKKAWNALLWDAIVSHSLVGRMVVSASTPVFHPTLHTGLSPELSQQSWASGLFRGGPVVTSVWPCSAGKQSRQLSGISMEERLFGRWCTLNPSTFRKSSL